MHFSSLRCPVQETVTIWNENITMLKETKKKSFQVTPLLHIFTFPKTRNIFHLVTSFCHVSFCSWYFGVLMWWISMWLFFGFIFLSQVIDTLVQGLGFAWLCFSCSCSEGKWKSDKKDETAIKKEYGIN